MQSVASRAAPEVLGSHRQVPLLDGRMVRQAFLDNAASTKSFRAVSDWLRRVEPYYSNIHRGTGYDSLYCTRLYEQARDILIRFVGGDPGRHVVIPVRNTTEGLNLLANTLALRPEERVLTTILEHHSNDLPWRGKARVEYIPIDAEGRFQIEELERSLSREPGNVRVVTITGASNVTGQILPVHEIAARAHAHGAWVVVDGAQLLPHRAFSMGKPGAAESVDFVVFSAHKMNSPYGEGAVIGLREPFADAVPYLQGGGTVYSVSLDSVIWADPPDRQEAGTPNILGMLAMARAVQVLESYGMDRVAAHEDRLTRRLLAGLCDLSGIRILGSCDPERTEDRLGVVSYTVDGLHHALVAAILAYEHGVSVRHGCFCAHPLIKKLLCVPHEEEERLEHSIRAGDRREIPGAVRVSIGLHNDDEDIDRFLDGMRAICGRRWSGRYEQDPETVSYTHLTLPTSS
ncbi:MAG: aminotransferase class V-fold PLP-dependent enzyme, partial [Candidatus Eisenbacteria bacterium]|nr:aminotransferase class V-fold PLP-dependent enzyme [Candidatus Eisenbacteria bacterium]